MNTGIKRIFIVGCPRSGTTLFQSMLALHSKILSFPESLFFPLVVEQREERFFDRQTRRSSRIRLYRSAFRVKLGISTRTRMPGKDTFYQALDEEMPAEADFWLRDATNRFCGMLDRKAAVSGCSVWLEKTPDHLNYVDIIKRFVPDAWVFHIYRNGPDTVASLWDAALKYGTHWRANYDTVDRCIGRWNRSIEITAKCIGRLNHIIIRYEDLVREPEVVLRHLVRLLDLPYEADMIGDRGAILSRLAIGSEKWKSGIGGKLEIRSKFTQVFDTDEQQYIIKRLNSTDALDKVAQSYRSLPCQKCGGIEAPTAAIPN